MKKIFLLFLVVCLAFGADDDNQNNADNPFQSAKLSDMQDEDAAKQEEQNANEKEADNIISSASEGRKVVTSKKAEVNEKSENRQFFRDEVILNWYYSFQKDNPRAAEVKGATAKDSLIKNVAIENNGGSGSGSGNTNDKTVVIKGYCFIREDINIDKQPASLRTECQTNYGAITLFGNLVKVNERATLALDVRYIEKNGYRFDVAESIVTNEDKTSYNIATYVNDRKLSELGWSTVEVATDEVKDYTNQYLQALKESRTKQEVVYTTSSSGSNDYVTPTTVTNTEKPDPLDYLIAAGINIGAATLKTFASIFKSDLPYLYQIVGKSKIWIDLKVKEQGEYVK